MATRLSLKAVKECWDLKAPFRISGYSFAESFVVFVEISDGENRGRGEAAGVYYLGDDCDHILSEIDSIRDAIERGLTRLEINELLPPGGARNALDCAMWELEAKRARRAVHHILGIKSLVPLLTTFTLGAADPLVMAEGARGYNHARAIKLKLLGDDCDGERVRMVREARPDVWLGVDANQGFTPQALERLLPALIAADVKLIEQPFPIGREGDLDGLDLPIPIAADESVQALADIAGLVGRFDIVNIKLDKCGGLTEGLAMIDEARRLGLGVMVGNMVGTSLAMAPAFILGQACDVVDLDGPIALASDRTDAVRYDDGRIDCPGSVWGGANEHAPA